MWAIRRAANPLTLRGHGYQIGVCRAFCAKSDIIADCFEHGVGTSDTSQFISSRCHPLQKRFYRRSYVHAKFSLWSHGLSSQADANKSGEEDNLEDEFCELEKPPSFDTIEQNNASEEDDELITEAELSDDDSGGNLEEISQNELKLSDTEEVTTDEVSLERTSSELLSVLTSSPPKSVHGALDKWIEKGNSLGRSEISLTMLNLRKRRMYGKALQFSEWLEENKRLNFEERDYASRLDLIAKVHGLHKAEKYIVTIPESFRGEVIYRTLLANCVVSVNVKKTEEVFNKMKDLDLPITAFACNQLLLLYKRLDKKKIADVLLFMEKENVKPTIFTYRLLIDTKGQSNDITGMEQLLETMKAEGLEPDILTQSTLARHYISGGLNEKAEAILKEMEGCNLKENRGACRALLPLYAELGKADEVGRVWMVCNTSPRLEECLAAIEAWGKLGRIEEAEAAFDKILQTWKRLSPRCYTSLLKVYANHKLLAKGKDLAKRMADDGCRIGPWTWDVLVKLYVEAGEVEKADSILQKASQLNHMKPLFNSYMCIMDQYAKKGDIHSTEKIFLRLKQSGYVGRARQYQSLLQAYINAKVPAYGFSDRLKADKVFPNKTIAAQLARVDAFRKTAISVLLD